VAGRGDRPRFLARQAGKRHPAQYTDSTAAALPDEPEAIDAETQRRFSEESARRWSILKAEEQMRQATVSRTNKLRQLETEAMRRRVDVTRHVAAIDKELTAMQSVIWP
jgi:hypothetical protein